MMWYQNICVISCQSNVQLIIGLINNCACVSTETLRRFLPFVSQVALKWNELPVKIKKYIIFWELDSSLNATLVYGCFLSKYLHPAAFYYPAAP